VDVPSSRGTSHVVCMCVCVFVYVCSCHSYRLIMRPLGLNGLLRMRTSSTFEISNVYGPLCASPTYENLYHLAAMGPSTSVTFDFCFTDQHGFYQYVE
jgi:hypothetical protein